MANRCNNMFRDLISNGQVQILGIVSIVPMDDWSETTKYQKLNYVRHNGATYLAKVPNNNVEPGVAPNWKDSWMLSIYDGVLNPNGTYPNFTAGKVVNALMWGNKSYDGSSPQTITASDLGLADVYKPQGSIVFSALPATPSADTYGYVWNITNDFTTDSRFVEGAGKQYSAGTNVGVIEQNGTYYYDVLGNFVDLSNYAQINGSYPEMTAGKAVRLSQSVKMQATNSAGGQLGWFKLAAVSGAKLAAINGTGSYSATLLINGINEPALSFGGIIEIDCRIESSQIVTDSNRVQPKILCGGLREEYICAVPNTETNELDVYFLINSSYAGYSVTVIDEGYTRLMQPSETAITLAGTFYNAEAPSGAVYAVNVNRAATAGMLSSTQLQSADDLNNLYGSEYYGKNFWWEGNGYPINAPYNSGGYLQVNNIAGYTLQAAYIFSVKSDNNIPTEYQRVKGQNGVWSEWEEIATSEGTYPNLTAGNAVRLARTATASGNNTENTIGWWKIGEVTSASLTEYVSFGGDYSIIFLINGISPMGSTTNFGKSGIIELDGRVENGAFLIIAHNQLKILGGNIEEGDISAVWSAEKIELYCNLKNGYSKQSFTVLSEIIHTTVVNCFAFAPSFVSASIPSGASIGVNQNRAAYDAAGNDIQATYATKTEVNAKYTKPATGIPESDLSEGVQDKLNSGGGIDNAVTYTEQTLTDEQQAQARENISAAGTRGTYPDLTAGKAISDADGNDIQTTYATKTEVNAKYTKPATGIPESDLSEGVQDKLNSGGGIDNAVTYTEQTLTDEQQAQARENISAAGTRGTYPDLTAGKAISDADGNDIQTTYATKTEVAKISSTGVAMPIVPQFTIDSDIEVLTEFEAVLTGFVKIPEIGDCFYAQITSTETSTSPFEAKTMFCLCMVLSISGANATCRIQSFTNTPPLHYKVTYSLGSSVGANISLPLSNFDRTPIIGETFEFYSSFSNMYCISCARVVSISDANVNCYTLTPPRQISQVQISRYNHYVSMNIVTAAGSGRLSMVINSKTPTPYSAVGNISAVLDGKGLTTSARSHEATGYISYNGKTFIIYGIYSPNSTSVMINCYNAEDHQDTPTGIDSATIKDTVEVLK